MNLVDIDIEPSTDPYAGWLGLKIADVTSRDLWPRKMRNVCGVSCLTLHRDELVRRATARAARMHRTAVRQRLKERPGARCLIIRFVGVTDILVRLALSLEHMEQIVDDCEARKGEGFQHTCNIKRLEELLCVAEAS